MEKLDSQSVILVSDTIAEMENKKQHEKPISVFVWAYI